MIVTQRSVPTKNGVYNNNVKKKKKPLKILLKLADIDL